MMHRKTTTLGLEERTERVLAYLFGCISGIFFLLFEKNRNVRWHALQSTIVFGLLWLCMFVISMIRGMLAFIPLIGFITTIGLNLLFSIVFWITILVWLWLLVMAVLRPNYRLPFLSMMLPMMSRK